MKATIVETSTRKNKDTGEVTYYVRVLAPFLEFGEIKQSTIDIKLPNAETMRAYAEKAGKVVEIPVLMPKPNYPLELEA